MGLLLLLGLTLAGCATGRGPRDPDISLPAAFETGQLGGSAQQLDQWWLLYSDPQLAGLVATGLASNFDARIALARLDEARAQRASSLARLGPQGGIEASGEARHTEELSANESARPGLPAGISPTQSGTSGSANLSFNVSWELDLFGRRPASRQVANADFAATRFNVEGARAAVAAEIADSLFEARSLSVQLADAHETLRVQRELERISRIRAERGLGPASDVARVQADVAQAISRTTDLEAQLDAARRAILLLIGQASASSASLAIGSNLGPVPLPPMAVPGELLVRRPDVREAEARIEAAAGNLRLAELELFPRITLMPSAGLSAQRGTFESSNIFWALGAGLVVPILDRPRLMAEIGVKGARAEQAVLSYERAVQTAYAEADQSLKLLAADRSRISVLEVGQAKARIAYDAALRRYRIGVDNLTAALEAERAWRTARSAASAAHSQALRRSVQVFRSLGGGWSPQPLETPA